MSDYRTLCEDVRKLAAVLLEKLDTFDAAKRDEHGRPRTTEPLPELKQTTLMDTDIAVSPLKRALQAASKARKDRAAKQVKSAFGQPQKIKFEGESIMSTCGDMTLTGERIRAQVKSHEAF